MAISTSSCSHLGVAAGGARGGCGSRVWVRPQLHRDTSCAEEVKREPSARGARGRDAERRYQVASSKQQWYVSKQCTRNQNGEFIATGFKGLGASGVCWSSRLEKSFSWLWRVMLSAQLQEASQPAVEDSCYPGRIAAHSPAFQCSPQAHHQQQMSRFSRF